MGGGGRSPKRRKSKRPVTDRPSVQRSAACITVAAVSLAGLLLTVYAAWKAVTLHPAARLGAGAAADHHARFYSFEVVNEFPHDPNAFTQGLVYGGNDTLFESTGLYHQVQNIYQLDGSFFGEGLTLLGERLFQLTWMRKIGFIYDRYNFNKIEKFIHPMHDGWGLATDGKVIFGSDGSSTLYHMNFKTLKAMMSVVVKYKGRDITYLNELEYINGEIWANIWQSDCIARISYKDGLVLGWIMLHKLRQGLIASGHTDIDVLNGIAWDAERNRLFVTGKLWPKLYEIKLQEIPGPLDGSIDGLC